MKAVGAVLVGLGWVAGASLWPVAASPKPGPQTPNKLSFSRDVLPILSNKCFQCHGPDAGTRMAGLRLDTPEGAFASRGGRFPVVPGKPEHSLILKRIHDKDMPMPPKSLGKPITDAESKILEQWIREGAHYGQIWSLVPLPAKVAVPRVNSAWPRDDLDRFVLLRQQKEGLGPAREATRLRWLRRVTLDLTGLPPTEAEMDAFVADLRPGAHERVVDRLLASPAFGERMAADWLDAARYSDSYGYQSDLLAPNWPYRDWVVRAFNANMPYDRFLTEQIAGDLLPNASRDQILATAFNRLHRQSNEGGSIALEFQTAYVDDRVDTFGTAVLGLTLACAKCHDHKFDPITQREYYQLFAYFNSIQEYGLILSSEIVPTPTLLLPTPEQEKQLADLKAASAAAKTARDQSAPATPGQPTFFPLDRFEGGKQGAAQLIGSPKVVPGRTGNALEFDGENGLVLRGLPGRERWDAFAWEFSIMDPRAKGPVVLLHRTGGTDVGFCGFDLMLEDGFLTARVMRHWPGNAVAVRTKNRIPRNAWTQIGWSWDGSGDASGLVLRVNGQRAPVEVLANSLWKKVNAYGDLGPSGGDWSFAQRFRDAGFKGGRLDDVRFWSQPFDARAEEAAVREAQRKLAEAEEGVQEIAVMRETVRPVPAYLLARGQYDAPRNDETRVVRDTPKALPPLRAEGANDRLALARWVADPNHPLTARVAVNRLWQMMFGQGIVESSENFGVQGSQPTHPELLDYLAREYVRSGWDTKLIVRRIALSATYRQDSARRGDKDPQNRLLTRGPSGRLSAEMIRDTALAAAGTLDRRIGGPPVNPYQPAGLWNENNVFSPAFVQSKGADLYRRSLYSTWKRTTPVPSMLLFDATAREACITRRPSTNTPLQALVLLNDVQYVEAARNLAERAMKASPSEAVRLRHAFRLLANRDPSPTEAAILARTLAEQRAIFAKQPEEAKKLASVGDSETAAGLDPVEVAAMAATVQAILNSDAVIWKR